jgi:hypothetical protein
MNSYDKPGSLDGAIDEAVREMMHMDPRPGLRQRVAGSIGARSQRTDGLRLGLAWAASLAAVGIVSVLVFRSPVAPPPVVSPRVAEVPPAVSDIPQAEPQAAEATRTTPARPRRRQDPAPESIFGPRANRLTAASVPAAVPPPLRGGDVDDAMVLHMPANPGGLPRITPIGVTPIHVAPIAIEPLSVSPLSHRR